MKTNFIYTIIIVVLLILSFIGGCSYHKKTFKCPTSVHDTILTHDTVIHNIPNYYPYYIQGKDSIIHDTIPRIVDTTKILQAYFDKHIYLRKWENDTLQVWLLDAITQNRPIEQEVNFKYRIKTPFTTIVNTIDNSVHYQKYVTAGLGVPFKDPMSFSLDLTYNAKIGYVGITYTPKLNSFGITGGVTLFKFK